MKHLLSKIILAFLLFLNILHANSCILDNDYVKLSINDDGTFGTSGGTLGIYNKSKQVDYLTYGIRFEFFSLKINDTIYANDNDEKFSDYEERKRKNNNNVVTQEIECDSRTNTAVLATKFTDQIKIVHTYTLKQNSEKSAYIQVDVDIENISQQDINNIKYARGIDPDPTRSDEPKTENSKGEQSKNISSQDLVYSQGVTSKAPLGIFTSDKNYKHNVAMIEMNPGILTYDPDIILDETSTGRTKNDSALYIGFDLGILKAKSSKQFSFRYILGDSIGDAVSFSSMTTSPGAIKIPYKNISSYEKLNNNVSIGIVSKDKNTKKYYANFTVSGLPDGIHIKLGENLLDSKNTKTAKPILIKQKNGRYKLPLEFSRNFEFKEKKPFEIKIKIETDSKDNISFETDTASFSFEPIARNIAFQVEPNNMQIPLDKLKGSEPFKIKIISNIGEIKPEEYKKFDLNIKVDGLNYHDHPDNNTHQYLVQLLPESPLCRTKVGKIPVTISVDEGFYPGDRQETILYVDIIDVTWWVKCKEVIINTLIILFAIWYLFCIFIRKNKFNGYQSLELTRESEDTRRPTKIHFTELVQWWQKLIPCKAEWAEYHNMLFIAYDGTNIKLSKKTLKGLSVNNKEIKQYEEDEVLYPNDTIKKGTKKYNFILRSK